MFLSVQVCNHSLYTYTEIVWFQHKQIIISCSLCYLLFVLISHYFYILLSVAFVRTRVLGVILLLPTQIKIKSWAEKEIKFFPSSFRIPQSRRLLFRQRFEIIDRPRRITFLSPPEGISGKATGDGSSGKVSRHCSQSLCLELSPAKIGTSYIVWARIFVCLGANISY